jgi:trehalose-6-phosphatase
LHSHVITQTAQTFVTTFLTRCLRANTEHQREDLSAIPALDVRGLLPRHRHSRARLLLLDFEGTLWRRDVTRAGLTKQFAPPEDAMELLNRLVQDDKNQVWLLSGLPVKGVMEQIAERVPNLGIV